jgi:hypothetical protein
MTIPSQLFREIPLRISASNTPTLGKRAAKENAEMCNASCKDAY